MSVQKFVLSKESSNFTIVPNKVIQGIKELELLGFYVYLLSLPPEWIFYKTQLKDHCRIGIKKLERFLSRLAQMNLIEIAQMRDEKGHFAHFDLRILNGDSFKIIDLDDCAPCVNIRTTVNGRTDMGSYKRNIDKVNIEKETSKSLCASDDARKSFDRFWDLYPRKKDKQRALDIWVKHKCEEKADLIIDKLRIQILNDVEWKDPKYILHPTTYLRAKRWEDEITLESVIPKKEHPVTAVIRELKEDLKTKEFKQLLN